MWSMYTCPTSKRYFFTIYQFHIEWGEENHFQYHDAGRYSTNEMSWSTRGLSHAKSIRILSNFEWKISRGLYENMSPWLSESLLIHFSVWNTIPTHVFIAKVPLKELFGLKWLWTSIHGAIQQRGAVEACWAHNSEVGRSKLLAATILFSSSSYLMQPTERKINRYIFWSQL